MANRSKLKKYAANKPGDPPAKKEGGKETATKKGKDLVINIQTGTGSEVKRIDTTGYDKGATSFKYDWTRQNRMGKAYTKHDSGTISRDQLETIMERHGMKDKRDYKPDPKASKRLDELSKSIPDLSTGKKKNIIKRK
jgi:hypothetical protein